MPRYPDLEDVVVFRYRNVREVFRDHSIYAFAAYDEPFIFLREVEEHHVFLLCNQDRETIDQWHVTRSGVARWLHQQFPNTKIWGDHRNSVLAQMNDDSRALLDLKAQWVDQTPYPASR